MYHIFISLSETGRVKGFGLIYVCFILFLCYYVFGSQK